ncbi:ATP-binding protein [Enterobacter sp. Acro-832]|uniref:ATP-binding protein n=1 Tax=Enterobacter sp. Acro-832 TaxID=2608348 RepID=UPI0014208B04|nr:ATP-binding protein [Enterobacter sp. Acro-832]NIG44980.1 ATP-binding protein [Enterobacter sp. Acro-832]
MMLSQRVPRNDLLDSVIRWEDNVFLVITGKNGEGKSRLLNKLIEQAFKSPDLYENIIATSTSVFEIFPSKMTMSDIKRRVKYHYIGTKSILSRGGNNRTSMNLIISSCLGLLRSYNEKYNNYSLGSSHVKLREMFQTIGFDPVLEYIIKIDPSVSILDDVFGGYVFEKKGERIAFESEKSKTLLIDELMSTFNSQKDRNNNIRLGYILGEDVRLYHGGKLEHRELDILMWLIDNEIVRIIDVRFGKYEQKRRPNEWTSMRLASSGEQSIILTLVGIASRIDNNSIIFIDEPEISLHPEWQERFIDFLKDIFDDYRNCLFVIATHSPQIISKLSNKKAYIYNINNEMLFNSSEYKERSSDYQLANVFNAPGSNNEYLTRILVSWLVKFSKNESFSKEEHSEMKNALMLKDKILEDDPVKRLMSLVEDTMRII